MVAFKGLGTSAKGEVRTQLSTDGLIQHARVAVYGPSHIPLYLQQGNYMYIHACMYKHCIHMSCTVYIHVHCILHMYNVTHTSIYMYIYMYMYIHAHVNVY